MTIFVRKNICERKLLEIQANSNQGNGVLCITNMAVAYEVDGRGIYLNFIPRKVIKKFAPVGSVLFGTQKFRITWLEDTECFFEFRTKQYKQLLGAMDTISIPSD